jgi:hypothetical protein
MMDEARVRDSGRLALATGFVAVGSAICLGTFFAVGGPFGTLNDIGNAATGVLSGWLAWRLRGDVTGRVGQLAVGAAVVGAVVTVVGSSLVVSGTTGFLFAGLVSSVGFAGIGAWLVILNRSRTQLGVWPGTLRAAGVVAGALMAAGILTLPAIPAGYDDMDTAPGWIWIGFVSWLGTYVVYPAWALAMGLLEERRAGARLPVGTVTE